MEAKYFNKIIEARANERAQAKIITFQDAVMKAFDELTGCPYGQFAHKDQGGTRGANYIILKAMFDNQKVRFQENWPRLIWEEAEEKVSNEILSTMDEMQKTLLAASKESNPNDCKPVEVVPE